MIKIFFKFFLVYLLFFTLVMFSIVLFDTDGVETVDVFLFAFALATSFALIFYLFDFIGYLKRVKKNKKNRKVLDEVGLDNMVYASGGTIGQLVFVFIVYIYRIFTRIKKEGINNKYKK